MLRVFFTLTVLLSSFSYATISQASDASLAAQTYLNSGNPDQSIKTAQRALKNANLAPAERLTLLSLIANAQIMIATHQRFEHVSTAIEAINVVLQEFPENAQSAEFRWQLAWMRWKAGDQKQAISAARDIITQDQQAANLRRAWLLMARIHIQLGNFSYARSDLLQYGLHVESGSHDQATGMAWMAIIDVGEKRATIAFKSLSMVYQKWPDILTRDPELFAAYIQLMHQYGSQSNTLKLSKIFIGQYIQTPYAPPVRLIHADIQAGENKTIDDAIKEYGILADKQAETSVGRQAFMRKMMLEHRQESERDKLIPVMIALKKIASNNQLSVIEDEAMLDLARLWVRLQQNDGDGGAKNTKTKTNNAKAPALQAYAHAATSLNKKITQAATNEGQVWMKKSIQQALTQQQWVKAVSLWRQFPQLRPATRQSQALQLGIAHAMRMLMLFDASEDILQALYKENKFSIRGERTMLELAKVWMDRQDKSAVKNIMRWLNRHEFSMYRPEMLLIAARIQLNQSHAEQAKQTLSSIRPGDMTDESRASFWHTKASVSEALAEWHSAARAWGKYRNSKGADSDLGLRNQAKAYFTAREFSQALKLYQKIPDDKRGAAWQYHVGLCQLRTGEIKQGTERLQTLAAATDGGRFTSLAKLALADKQAAILLEETP